MTENGRSLRSLPPFLSLALCAGEKKPEFNIAGLLVKARLTGG